MRRTAAAAGILLVAAGPTLAAGESPFFDRVYLTEAEAVDLQKDDSSDRATAETVTLTPAEVERLRRDRRVRIFTDSYRVWSIARAGETAPYRRVVLLQEPGQHEYMDLAIGVDASGAIHRVDLLVYREPQGGEVASRRFMDQFRGKTIGSPLRVNRDVVHIVGATISAHAVAAAARRALGILRLRGMIP